MLGRGKRWLDMVEGRGSKFKRRRIVPNVQLKRADAVVLRDVPLPIHWGARSNKDSETWSCGNCLQLNEPSENLLIDLPAFKCRNCWAVRDVDFKFCFGDLLVNGISPIGDIKNQGRTGQTAEPPTLEPLNLLGDHFFQQMVHKDYNDPELELIDLGRYDPYSIMRSWVSTLDVAQMPDYSSSKAEDSMVNILRTKGIYNSRYRRRYKVLGVEYVENNFESISAALANGHPLLADTFPGASFGYQQYDDVYRSPYNASNTPEGTPGHSVVLVGARRSSLFDYYFFVNSYGTSFCERVRNGMHVPGGIGKIRASDIVCPPYRFFRCVVDENH